MLQIPTVCQDLSLHPRGDLDITSKWISIVRDWRKPKVSGKDDGREHTGKGSALLGTENFLKLEDRAGQHSCRQRLSSRDTKTWYSCHTGNPQSPTWPPARWKCLPAGGAKEL